MSVAARFRAHIDEARPPLMVQRHDWMRESALLAVRIEALELDNESLTVINARVEQENKYMLDAIRKNCEDTDRCLLCDRYSVYEHAADCLLYAADEVP